MSKLTLNKQEQALIDLVVSEVIKKLDARDITMAINKGVKDGLEMAKQIELEANKEKSFSSMTAEEYYSQIK